MHADGSRTLGGGSSGAVGGEGRHRTRWRARRRVRRRPARPRRRSRRTPCAKTSRRVRRESPRRDHPGLAAETAKEQSSWVFARGATDARTLTTVDAHVDVIAPGTKLGTTAACFVPSDTSRGGCVDGPPLSQRDAQQINEKRAPVPTIIRPTYISHLRRSSQGLDSSARPGRLHRPRVRRRRRNAMRTIGLASPNHPLLSSRRVSDMRQGRAQLLIAEHVEVC